MLAQSCRPWIGIGFEDRHMKELLCMLVLLLVSSIVVQAAVLAFSWAYARRALVILWPLAIFAVMRMASTSRSSLWVSGAAESVVIGRCHALFMGGTLIT